MIRNGMWGVLFLPDPCKQDNNLDLLLNNSIFTMDYTKPHIKSLKDGSEVDQYMGQNLTW